MEVQTIVVHVSVNHIQIFYTHTYHVVMYIYITFTLTRSQCKYFSNTLTRPCVNVLGHVSVITKIICKVTLSLGLLTPQTLLSGVSIKLKKFIKIGKEMLKINI